MADKTGNIKSLIIHLVMLLQPIGIIILTFIWGWNLNMIIPNIIIVLGFGVVPYLAYREDNKI